jgi:type I restriction enzyme R subunit
MNHARHSEGAFETVIETTMLANGTVPEPAAGFDPELAIFPEVALAFIRETQAEGLWAKLWRRCTGSTPASGLSAALCKWMDDHGVLTTLRHGFKCYGKTLRIAFFKPAHGLNPALQARYEANILGITRQLHFSTKHPRERLDVTLSLNGIPLVTVELKNPLSGSTAADALHQYRHDRDHRERIFAFKQRTLVHFAVDTEVVHMTTRLAGCGHAVPALQQRLQRVAPAIRRIPRAESYRTAYLWEEVLSATACWTCSRALCICRSRR